MIAIIVLSVKMYFAVCRRKHLETNIYIPNNIEWCEFVKILL